MNSAPLALERQQMVGRWAGWIRSRWRLLLLVAVFALGLALRWDRLDYVEFTSDQAWPLGRALDIVTKGDLPVRGFQSSVYTAHGPVELYLLAIPAAVSADPRVATGFVGLLQMLAVAGTYFLGSRFFSASTGLAAAALFAVNPWAIHYARKLWTPDMTPALSTLFFILLYVAVVRRNRLAFAAAFPAYALLFLTHPSAIVFAPLFGLVYLAFWRRFGFLPLLAGSGLALAVASPYLYNDYQNGFQNLRGYFTTSTAQAYVDLEALKYMTTLASGQYFPDMTGVGFRGAWTLPVLPYANDIANALLAAGLGFSLFRVVARRQTGWEAYLLMVLWFAFPVIVSLRHAMELFPHYFLVAYPVQFLLIAVGLRETIWLAGKAVARLRPQPLLLTRALGACVVLYLGVSQVLFIHRYVDYLESNGPLGPYGPPLIFSEKAVNVMRDIETSLDIERVYVYSFLQQTALDYLARPDVALRHVEPPSGITLPGRPGVGALAVLTSDEIPVRGHEYRLVEEGNTIMGLLREAGFVELPEWNIRGPDGHLYYRFFHLKSWTADNSLGSTFRPVLSRPGLANGLRLLGYSLPDTATEGGLVELKLLWALPDTPPNAPTREFNLFVHLIGLDGRARAQQDIELFQYSAWRSDDQLITTHQVAVPPGSGQELLWLNIGCYSRLDRAEVPWLDDAGRPNANAFKVGPIKIPADRGFGLPPEVLVGSVFGDTMKLDGYSLQPVAPRPGEQLVTNLYWRADSRPPADYTVSVQLLDREQQLVAQHDSPPAEGRYPTSYWQRGKTVLDAHGLALPGNLPAGEYALQVVVYDPTNGKRLTIDGRDSLDLGKVLIGR
ncbi:MAG: ArnT family glycosyltransferase [Chloroflexota bacterium]